ncbi:hypothetical protein TNCV_273531 [Trichonephila clavipes]|nr:hypothetical protein TNCV_273531 [Trichonephila clavipes]
MIFLENIILIKLSRKYSGCSSQVVMAMDWWLLAVGSNLVPKEIRYAQELIHVKSVEDEKSPICVLGKFGEG